jgi:tungstate transport system substrate-binding protein
MIGMVTKMVFIKRKYKSYLYVASIICISIIVYINYVILLNNSTVIRVSTTYSLEQMGVLKLLLNDFLNKTGLNVRFEVLARGSGEALRLLADGSTCIAFTHAPVLEAQYMKQGKVKQLAVFAYNEFVIVGPVKDPANIIKAVNAIEAFKRIYIAGEEGKALFVSRNDYSGTHTKEIQLWNLTRLNPYNRQWYLKTGQGMIQTLIIADNINAYTLSDIGTYLTLNNNSKLRNIAILKKDLQNLINLYAIYFSNSEFCIYVRDIADQLADYIMKEGQDFIETKFKGLINPVKGHENEFLVIWKSLAGMK